MTTTMASSRDEMDPRTPLLKDSVEEEIVEISDDDDDELEDPQKRQEIERALLWKLDKRMSILILIYVLNFVSGSATRYYLDVVH